MKLFLTIVAFCMTNFCLIAQNATPITGKVHDATGLPLPKAQLYLFTAKDTVLLDQAETDSQGLFVLNNNTKLDVFVMASRPGFTSATQNVNDKQLYFTLYKDVTNTLNEAMVSVTQKSTLKHVSGKFVFTPKGIDLEGVNAFEMLKHVPLLNASQDGVKIMGIGSSSIYINGRKPIETGDALMEKIRSISPEQISKIEIITTPGASHNASTRGGIINLVIRQNYVGWAGKSTTALEYQNEFGASENFNLRYGKDRFNASVYLNSSLSKWKLEGIDDYNYIDIGREVANQYSNKGRDAKLNASFDISYAFSKNHKMGLSGCVSSGYNKAQYATLTETKEISEATKSRTDRSYKYPFNQKPSYGVLAYYTWTTDSKGSKLNIDFDHSSNGSKQDYEKSFSTLNKGAIYVPYSKYTEYKSYNAYSTDAKVSYDMMLNSNHNMSLGYELNASKVINSYNRNDLLKTDDGASVYDGTFKYLENVQAFYIAYQSMWSNIISTKLGVRGEYAYRDGIQSSIGGKNKHHEFDWFPSANIDFDFVENKHSLSFEYTRKIHRPFLSELDPFVFWKSETSYTIGNPDIKPFYLNDFLVYYELYEDYIFNLSFQRSKNGITDYSYQDGHGNTINSKMNIASDVSIMLNFEVNKMLFDGRWRISAQISGDYTKSKSGTANVDGTNFDYSEFSGDCSLSSTIRLSKRKRWNAEIYAYGATASTFTSKKVKPSYYVHAILTKTFKFGGILQFTTLNLLYSKSNRNWSYRTENYAINSMKLSTKRSFSITFSIPFGKSNVRGASYKNSNQLKSRL